MASDIQGNRRNKMIKYYCDRCNEIIKDINENVPQAFHHPQINIIASNKRGYDNVKDWNYLCLDCYKELIKKLKEIK